MSLRRGQIVLVNYPFTDQSAGKIRPALIVSARACAPYDDYIVVPLSSRVSHDDFSMSLDRDASWFPQTKLRRQTRSIRWSILLTVNVSVFHRKLGMMPSELMKDILGRIRSLFQ